MSTYSNDIWICAIISQGLPNLVSFDKDRVRISCSNSDIGKDLVYWQTERTHNFESVYYNEVDFGRVLC